MSSSPNNSYADEFKQSSAKLAVESKQSISKTANSLGVKLTTLYGWMKKYYPNYNSQTKTQASDSETEIKRLKKELSQVKQERDILKKAAAYFASEIL